jgi:hypothetical protein
VPAVRRGGPSTSLTSGGRYASAPDLGLCFSLPGAAGPLFLDVMATFPLLDRVFGPDENPGGPLPTLPSGYGGMLPHIHQWTEREAAGIVYWECTANQNDCRATTTDEPPDALPRSTAWPPAERSCPPV